MEAKESAGVVSSRQGESSEKVHDAPVYGGDRGDHGADTELQRRLSTRHLTMIALGSSIGQGLWLGSGTSLASGGPAGIFLGYLLAGSMIWCVSHSIGEMACIYPLPSAFVQWTDKFVDRSAAFALGWSYWFNYTITIANELQGANSVIGFWTHAVPIAAWITIFWAVVVLVNVGAVSVFGEIEVVASTIKFSWIFVVIISGIVISAGGAPNHEAVGFRYWHSDTFAGNGFKGFLSVLPTCIFAMAGSENAGLVAAETANPRKSVPRAVGSIWLRLSLFYLLGSLIVSINVDPKNPEYVPFLDYLLSCDLSGLAGLFGASGTNASPFVIAYRDAYIPALAHLMNVIILISVVSTGTISCYGGSRTTVGLAQLGMAPKQFSRADKMGRPWWALIPTFVIGGGLAYINVSESGADVFTWFSNLTSLLTLFGWGMGTAYINPFFLICLSHIRFRWAWAAQGRTPEELPWKSWIYPYGAWWGLVLCCVLIVVEFYLAVSPLGDDMSAVNFFANYVSVIAVLALYVGARIYYRGQWYVRLDTIDLDASRRFYKEEVDTGKPKNIVRKAVGIIFD